MSLFLQKVHSLPTSHHWSDFTVISLLEKKKNILYIGTYLFHAAKGNCKEFHFNSNIQRPEAHRRPAFCPVVRVFQSRAHDTSVFTTYEQQLTAAAGLTATEHFKTIHEGEIQTQTKTW